MYKAPLCRKLLLFLNMLIKVMSIQLHKAFHLKPLLSLWGIFSFLRGMTWIFDFRTFRRATTRSSLQLCVGTSSVVLHFCLSSWCDSLRQWGSSASCYEVNLFGELSFALFYLFFFCALKFKLHNKYYMHVLFWSLHYKITRSCK